MTSLKSLSDYSIKNDINFSSQNKNNVKEDKYEIPKNIFYSKYINYRWIKKINNFFQVII